VELLEDMLSVELAEGILSVELIEAVDDWLWCNGRIDNIWWLALAILVGLW
jgi:hypothetical protein